MARGVRFEHANRLGVMPNIFSPSAKARGVKEAARVSVSITSGFP